jgi:hypothetical protein
MGTKQVLKNLEKFLIPRPYNYLVVFHKSYACLPPKLALEFGGRFDFFSGVDAVYSTFDLTGLGVTDRAHQALLEGISTWTFV